MNTRTPLLTMTLALAILALATPTQAIYIETPLKLGSDAQRADVGDDVEFEIEPDPENESARKDWAGKTVKVGYSYDKNERQGGDDPDAPTSNEGYTEKDLTSITLDDEARGTFTWKIPDELDGYNLNVFLEDDDGERLAFARLAIGDAPEQMHIMNGPGGEPEIDENDAVEETGDDGSGAANEAPSLPLFGLVVAIGAAAIALGLRRP